MYKLIIFYTAAMLSPLASANDNMTNERLPVTKYELQQHWKVDCDQLKSSLSKAYTDTNIAQVLLNDISQSQEQLLLCSIIYDRFSKDSNTCNAYRDILNLLKSASAAGISNFSPKDNTQWLNALNCISASSSNHP